MIDWLEVIGWIGNVLIITQFLLVHLMVKQYLEIGCKLELWACSMKALLLQKVIRGTTKWNTYIYDKGTIRGN